MQNEANEFKNRGNELYKKKQFAEALEMYDRAIEKESNDLTYYNNKCAVWIEMGEEKYDSVLETCPRQPELRDYHREPRRGLLPEGGENALPHGLRPREAEQLRPGHRDVSEGAH